MTDAPKKTYKREVAGACLIAVALMTVALFSMNDVAKINALVPFATGLGMTVVVSALAAFGLHNKLNA